MILLPLLIISIISLTACTKKEASKPPLAPQSPQSPQSMTPPGHGDIQMPSAGEMRVIIPDDVKAMWKGVILTVMDRETAAINDYTVPIGGKFSIPGTKIDVQTKDFLPDLKIEGNIYTTTSYELLNPAIRVLITEDGKEIFSGWLFQKFPSVHPFKHQRFGITLKEPVDTL